MKKWPRISIITPSFNQANFIEKTIRSVLDQTYPNLEYIVMDGGSTDGTIKILRKWSKKIIWYSQKDNGQADAINKGLKKATGEIITYLNSDDLLMKGSLCKAVGFFQKNPDKKWVFGKCRIIDKKEKEVRKLITAYKNFFLKRYNYSTLLVLDFISQPAVFWKRELLNEVGNFNEKEFYELDYEYWLRLGKKYNPGYIDNYLASFRVHEEAKSGSSFFKHYWQEFKVASRFTKNPIILCLHFLNFISIVVSYESLNFFKK